MGRGALPRAMPRRKFYGAKQKMSQGSSLIPWPFTYIMMA